MDNLISAKRSLRAAWQSFKWSMYLFREVAVIKVLNGWSVVRHPIEYYKFRRLLRKINRIMSARLEAMPEHGGTDRTLYNFQTPEEMNVKSADAWLDRETFDSAEQIKKLEANIAMQFNKIEKK